MPESGTAERRWPDPRRARSPHRLAAPGLHIIAELKRSSPSAGRIADDGDDLVTRARAYESGGAAAISVLCEPHWFNGSVDDLRRVREAVSVPILAKEFVVDPRQLRMLRAAGADVVLLLAVLHPEKRLAELVRRAFELGLEPLVEAHTQAELEAALATDARLIGINNRDLRTLEVDTERADRLRSLVPDDRIVIAESGVRDASTIERWRALAFDGALVGEALMRADDPAAAVRSVRQRRASAQRPCQRRATALREDLRDHHRGGYVGGGPRRCRCGRTQRRRRHAARTGARRSHRAGRQRLDRSATPSARPDSCS